MIVIKPFKSRLAALSMSKAYGAELAADWAVYGWWRLHAAYSYLEINARTKDQSIDYSATGELDPHHQVSLRSQMDIGRTFELDLWLRYVGVLPTETERSFFAMITRNFF